MGGLGVRLGGGDYGPARAAGRRAQIVATPSMMRKALHMGMMDIIITYNYYIYLYIRAQIMATTSMMKKALHMGRSEAERAARIFLDDSRRPKRRTTRRARRMLMGNSRGPRAMRDAETTRASKTDLI
jgi:hypothetical protein